MNLDPSIEDLLHRSIDGALSDKDRARLERHLAAHPEDAERLAEMRRQSALLAGSVPVPSAGDLRALRQRAANAPSPLFRVAASAAIFAVGLGLGAFLAPKDGPDTGDLALFASQAKAAHSLYVSEVLHPVEVTASESDHLQTWLSNRLGAAIIAPELGDSGYSLIGGRLLPAGDRASALFMYEDKDGNRLSLMATHGAAAQSQSFRFEEEGGYLVVSWQNGPWQYSLVGAEPREPMDRIARKIHGQMI